MIDALMIRHRTCKFLLDLRPTSVQLGVVRTNESVSFKKCGTRRIYFRRGGGSSRWSALNNNTVVHVSKTTFVTSLSARKITSGKFDGTAIASYLGIPAFTPPRQQQQRQQRRRRMVQITSSCGILTHLAGLGTITRRGTYTEILVRTRKPSRRGNVVCTKLSNTLRVKISLGASMANIQLETRGRRWNRIGNAFDLSGVKVHVDGDVRLSLKDHKVTLILRCDDNTTSFVRSIESIHQIRNRNGVTDRSQKPDLLIERETSRICHLSRRFLLTKRQMFDGRVLGVTAKEIRGAMELHAKSIAVFRELGVMGFIRYVLDVSRNPREDLPSTNDEWKKVISSFYHASFGSECKILTSQFPLYLSIYLIRLTYPHLTINI